MITSSRCAELAAGGVVGARRRRRACRRRRRRRRAGTRTGPCPRARTGSRRAPWTISSTPWSVSSSWSGWSSASYGPRREHLVEPRVVLHRAGAEQADAHHPERLLREVQVVALDLELGQLGQLPARARGRRWPGRGQSASPTVARTSGSASGVSIPRRPSRPAPSRAARPRRPRGSGAGSVLIADHLLERRRRGGRCPPGCAPRSRSRARSGRAAGDSREVAAAEDAALAAAPR